MCASKHHNIFFSEKYFESENVIISRGQKFRCFRFRFLSDLFVQGFPLDGAHVEELDLAVVVDQPQEDGGQACEDEPKDEENFQPDVAVVIHDQPGQQGDGG